MVHVSVWKCGAYWRKGRRGMEERHSPPFPNTGKRTPLSSHDSAVKRINGMLWLPWRLQEIKAQPTNPTALSPDTLARRKAVKRKMTASFAVLVVLLAAMAATAQEFPPPGGIKLLPGYHHQPQHGIDSKIGTISKAGGLQIHYDVGEMAGTFTGCEWCGWSKGEVWRKRQIIDGQEAVLIFTKQKRLVVSFPNVHANFYATIQTQAEMADMLLMLFTFQSPQVASRGKGTH
jgi:hypothetical protein